MISYRIVIFEEVVGKRSDAWASGFSSRKAFSQSSWGVSLWILPIIEGLTVVLKHGISGDIF